MFPVFKRDVGVILKEVAKNQKTDDEAIHLSQATSIVRHMFTMGTQIYDGSFKANCQEMSVPPSLLSLMGMIIQEQSIASVRYASAAQSFLTIAELIQFNSIKSKEGTYLSEHETFLPVSVALAVHAKNRKR